MSNRYYVYPPASITPKPLVLVTGQEVSEALNQINNELKLDLKFPTVPNESGFMIDFEDDGQPSPRFLGTSYSKEDYSMLEQSIPEVDLKTGAKIYLEAEDRVPPTEAYRAKMESAVVGTKNKSKASKTNKSNQKKKSKNGNTVILLHNVLDS